MVQPVPGARTLRCCKGQLECSSDDTQLGEYLRVLSGSGETLVKLAAVSFSPPYHIHAGGTGILHGGFVGTIMTSPHWEHGSRVYGFSSPVVDAGLAEYVTAPPDRLAAAPAGQPDATVASHAFSGPIAAGMTRLLRHVALSEVVMAPAEHPACLCVAALAQAQGRMTFGVSEGRAGTRHAEYYSQVFESWEAFLTRRPAGLRADALITIETAVPTPLSILEVLGPGAVWISVRGPKWQLDPSFVDPRVMILSLHKRLERVITSYVEDMYPFLNLWTNRADMGFASFPDGCLADLSRVSCLDELSRADGTVLRFSVQQRDRNVD